MKGVEERDLSGEIVRHCGSSSSVTYFCGDGCNVKVGQKATRQKGKDGTQIGPTPQLLPKWHVLEIDQ